MNLPIAILAGGLATRLGPIAERTPKALIDVYGKPFIFHQLELLSAAGFRTIVLCVGHLGGLIEQAVGDGRRWGVDVRCVYDGARLRGTGGALLGALPHLGPAFFLQYGDSYLTCDYHAIARAFEKSQALGLVAVYPNCNRWDASNALFEEGRIIRYDKHRPTSEMRHIDYGVAVLRAAAIQQYDRETSFDLAHVYSELAMRGELAAYEASERFYEIGSVDGLSELRRVLRARGNRQEVSR